MKCILLAAAMLTTLGAAAQSSLTKRFDSLTNAYAQTGYHGVILVAKGNQVLYEKGYGLADFDRKIPQTPETLFKTESVGKMFTATAVLQLVECGKLRLNTTLKELLPELNIKNSDKITIDHLLKHTSGLQSPWDHPQWKFNRHHTKAELVKIVEEVPAVFDEPGKEMYYSNSGYYILGWIIEKLTGKPYEQYFQQQFFTPLGMTHTRPLNDTVMPKDGAQPYRIISSKRYLAFNEGVGPDASPAGGWISTAGDLYRFTNALHNGRLLKPATLQIMRTANGANPKDSSYRYYAYGLETYVNSVLPGINLYGHNGGGAGFSIDAFADPASGTVVVSCTNLYQNSRPIMTNYMSLALSKPLQPVTKSAMVMIYDAIDSLGMEAFSAQSDALFKQMKVDAHPGVFARLGETMAAVGEHERSKQWMALGRKRFPEEGMLCIISGDLAMQAGDKAAARKLFEEGQALGEKRNDTRVVGAAKEKLKSLM